jgi:hypothetical protein
MKGIVLLCTVVLAVASAVANAAPGTGCAQIVQNINDSVSAIDDDADSYWAHRANFVDLIFGPSSRIVPDAKKVAEQEKAQAEPLKAGMPNRLASLKGLLTAARAQDCLTPAQLSAIAEPTIKHSKRVNFDQFPPEEPFQSTTDRGPPEMPRN